MLVLQVEVFGNLMMLGLHLIQFLMNFVNQLELSKLILMIQIILFMLELVNRGQEIVFQLEMDYINPMMVEIIGKK